MWAQTHEPARPKKHQAKNTFEGYYSLAMTIPSTTTSKDHHRPQGIRGTTKQSETTRLARTTIDHYHYHRQLLPYRVFTDRCLLGLL